MTVGLLDSHLSCRPLANDMIARLKQETYASVFKHPPSEARLAMPIPFCAIRRASSLTGRLSVWGHGRSNVEFQILSAPSDEMCDRAASWARGILGEYG